MILMRHLRHAHQAVRSTLAVGHVSCRRHATAQVKAAASPWALWRRPLPPHFLSMPPLMGIFLLSSGHSCSQAARRGFVSPVSTAWGAQPPGRDHKGRRGGERDSVCVYLTTKRKEVTITHLELMKNLLIARGCTAPMSKGPELALAETPRRQRLPLATQGKQPIRSSAALCL